MTQVSIEEKYLLLVLIDCGLKNNQLRILCQLGAKVTVFPWNYPVKQDEFDGLLLSNGPGDPQTQCSDTIATITSWINSQTIKPIFGIGLGHQLMALAAGMKTVKLKYGSRGHNQLCLLGTTGRWFNTSHNHGFAVDRLQGLAKDWKPCAGPRDTENLFQIFLDVVQSYKSTTPINLKSYLIEQLTKSFNNNNASSENSYHPVRKILILGSRDSLIFGQAGGYYDAATQATEAIKAHNIATVVINSNTDLNLTSKRDDSNKIFMASITETSVTKVIEHERPDGIFLSCGGQVALNCGVELYKSGFLQKYSCNVLGTPIKSIQITQDRSLFTQHMTYIEEKVVPYEVVNSLQEALKSAERFGYPVLVRYDVVSLDDRRSSYANNREELISLDNSALIDSSQLFIDKSVKGWKKIQYEVVRDHYDNFIVICNMENIDPLALRTGESIVVVPSQTLSNDEYSLLRSVSIKIVRHLSIIGACNVQFALNPLSSEYYIMRVNTQLSRSSALASKATGYPLAFITAELAIGMRLTNLNNSFTDETFAYCEPSLDYVVIKAPKLDLRKFLRYSNEIESSIESVDEVMSIGRSFEEAFQQALRMIHEDVIGFHPYSRTITDDELNIPTDERIFLLATALRQGYTVERLFELTKIDRWFLHKFQSIIQFIVHHFNSSIIQNKSLLLEAKRLGFSDQQISIYCGSTEVEVRASRQQFVIKPLIKQIATVSDESPTQINYFYLTYHGNQDDIQLSPNKETSILVLGSFFYEIGK
ncbi:unnamed protein product [Rotaria sp. Silwood2]|nr:unnamed protein product [Rotaria sp. Silwood2]